MKLKALIETAEKLTRIEIGMGLEQMSNSEIVLAGGMRSGNSRANLTRLKYMIYDVSKVTKQMTEEDMNKNEVGFVELFIEDGSGDIEGLVNIYIKPVKRKGGFGRKVVEALNKTTKQLKIYDIKHSAISFWVKLGITFYEVDFETVIKSPRKQKNKTLVGILK